MVKFGRNELCWCGSGKKYKRCHERFDNTLAFYKAAGALVPSRKLIKNDTQIQGIRQSARINIAVLNYVAEHIQPGITTAQIDEWVYEQTSVMGGIPAPLNYEGFPKSVCTSVNEVVCHGIPSKDTVLKDGDIINVDVSTVLNGFYSDSSRMFCIGNVSAEKKRLVDIAKQSLEVGLAEVRPWQPLGNMGQAIHDFIKVNGYSVVREIGGHGIGLAFHEDPWVSYVSRHGEEMLMVPGMMFTIEPMINMGSHCININKNDGWTVTTKDGLPSAQWEIQVLVTEAGHEIVAY